MKFIGTGKRLEQDDIGNAAKQIGIQTAVLLAFMEVESAGSGFDRSNRPKMLFEPHIAWRKFTGALRDRAAAAGLAYAKWKPGEYPADSYPRLAAAIEIDDTAGLLSASYGLFQIMGFNHSECGHKSVQEMFETAKRGEYQQLLQAVILMKSWGMVSMLTGKDFSNSESWRPSASKWNGGSYAKNNYHVKLAVSFMKHAGLVSSVVTHVSSVLKIGSKGEAVRNLQVDLQTLGYVFEHGVDGRFGNETKKHVSDFQLKNQLHVDGWAGNKTLKKISEALKQLKVDKSPDMPVFDKHSGLIYFILEMLKGIFK